MLQVMCALSLQSNYGVSNVLRGGLNDRKGEKRGWMQIKKCARLIDGSRKLRNMCVREGSVGMVGWVWMEKRAGKE
jgi:hypothetical protein